jgi:hypothetical protein
MVGGGVSETARATRWACAAASTVAADRILMLLMTLKQKPRIAKERTTRVTCIAPLCIMKKVCLN